MIEVKTGLLSSGAILEYLKNLPNNFVIITDHNVEKLYAKYLIELFKKNNLNHIIITIPAGEHAKTQKYKTYIENKMFESGYGRDTTILALGGGIVTDLSGFVASTYCRGIKAVFIPTTLLAMVDAALGGKNGINNKFGKNLVGSFYNPEKIFCDPAVLNTLNADEFYNGMAETIKHAIIDDRDFFENLYSFNDVTEEYEKLIKKSIDIKLKYISQDPLEQKGPRQLLNFGHTIGHALEKHFNYQIGHGHAVKLGILVEAKISVLLNILGQNEFEKIQQILNRLKFSQKFCIYPNDIQSIINILSIDKKSINQTPRFVLIEKIGKPYIIDNKYVHEVPNNIIYQAFEILHTPCAVN